MIPLTENESALIVDALNGTLIDPAILAESILWQEIEDAVLLDKLDAKWRVDGPALVAKLKSASHEDAMRIVKLAQEFWSDAYHVQDTYARVRALGMANAVEPGDALLTPTAAAKLCHRSVSALGQLVLRGKLAAFIDPSIANPRHATRYRKSEILALRPKSRKEK